MDLALLFAPQGSPTYAPLGMATLSAAVREGAPGCGVRLVDANIAAWTRCASMVPGGLESLEFFKGRRGNFYDEEEYSANSTTLAAMEAKLSSLGSEVRKSLNGGELGPQTADFLAALLNPLLTDPPHTVGFSFFSLGQLPWILALAKMAKERLGCRVVIGGASATAIDHGELLAACPFVDGIVLGEGDEAAAGLARCAPLEEISGLARFVDGSVKTNKPASPAVARAFPAPDFSGLDLSAYLNPTPVLPILASRGCKWGRCLFCAHNSTYLGGYRPLGARATAEHIKLLTGKYGASHFYFADLYLDAPEMDELSGAILAEDLRISYHVLGRPTAAHTPKLLERAAKAGLRWISWGVESGSDRLLADACKGTRAREVEEVLAASHRAGISSLAMMIFGLPGSTEGDAEETYRFLERIYPHIDAMTASPFALFSNSSYGRSPERWGLIPVGRQEELKVAGRSIHSKRVDFMEEATTGTRRPPRGEVEAAGWTGRRRWLGDVPFLEGLPCEHYLLYVAHRYSTRIASTGSSLEARQEG